MNDEYCPKHDRWFGPQPCAACRQEARGVRAQTSAAYTAYVERGGKLDFQNWQRRRAAAERGQG